MPGFTAFVAYSWTILQKGNIYTRVTHICTHSLGSINPITLQKSKGVRKEMAYLENSNICILTFGHGNNADYCSRLQGSEARFHTLN